MKNYILFFTIVFFAFGYSMQAQSAHDEAPKKLVFFNFDNSGAFYYKENRYMLGSQINASQPVGTYNTNPNGSIFFQVERVDVLTEVNVFTYQREFRLNLIEFNNYVSFSVNVPLGIRANYVIEEDMPNLGYVAAAIGQLNFFLGSTRNELDRAGFRLGFGYLHQNKILPIVERYPGNYWIARAGIVFPINDRLKAIDFTFTPIINKVKYYGDFSNLKPSYYNYYLALSLSYILD